VIRRSRRVSWGENTNAQAGLPINVNLTPPAAQIAPPTRVLTSQSGPPLEGVIDLTFVGLQTQTCARTSNLDVVCWGNSNPYAKPYLDDTQTPVTGVGEPLAATANGLVYVDASGLLRSNGKVLQSQPCAP
jgi:hypothetical protein